MDEKTIAFFSSDARELYKADIYRALSLPIGYIIHFRYPKQYINDKIKTTLTSLIGQNGIIFYVSGNNTKLKEENRKIKIFSIRRVKVKDFEDNKDNDIVHFYLEVGEFVDATLHHDTIKSDIPPYIFVSNILVEHGPNNEWGKRVDAVRNDFGTLPFFYITQAKQNKKILTPIYSEADRSSSYYLSDESNYQLPVILYDPKLGKTGITVDNQNPIEVSLSIPAGYRIGTEKDLQVFKLQTHSIQERKLLTYSCIRGIDQKAIKPLHEEADYSVIIEWTVTRGMNKLIQFGLLSLLAAIGVSSGTLATSNLSTITFSYMNILLACIAMISIFFAAGLLYDFFNKK